MKSKAALVIQGLTALVGALMAALNVSEWIRIGILGRTKGYPFGGEGPVVYYYKTAFLYALVNCIFGALFLVLVSLVVWARIRSKERIGWIAAWGILAAVIVMMLNGQIPP